MRAIIPVAGLGTRLLPASKAIPKEMLPIGDKPIIQWVIEEAASAGITQIILVTRAGKETIENHFDSCFEVEHILDDAGEENLLQKVRQTVPNNVDLISIRQKTPQGLGHAILCAKPLLDGEAFTVLLPDVLVMNSLQSTSFNQHSDIVQIVQRWQKSRRGQILVTPVPHEQVGLYGIADCQKNQFPKGEAQPIVGLIEKPSPVESLSNLSVVGRYVLPIEVLDILQYLAKDDNREIQLTEALQQLLTTQPLDAYNMDGVTWDCGNRQGYLCAQLAVSLAQDPSMKDTLLNIIA